MLTKEILDSRKEIIKRTMSKLNHLSPDYDNRLVELENDLMLLDDKIYELQRKADTEFINQKMRQYFKG